MASSKTAYRDPTGDKAIANIERQTHRSRKLRRPERRTSTLTYTVEADGRHRIVEKSRAES